LPKERAVADSDDRALLEAELRARVANSGGGYDEGVWRLVLGEPEEGLAAIRRVLPRLLEATRGQVVAAQLALLVDDASAVERAVGPALGEARDQYVAGNRAYLGALLALLAGDEGLARSHQETLERYTATHDKLAGGQPKGIAAVSRGLIDRDPERAASGLDALLAWHLRRARARSEIFNSSRGVISLDAIVAILLAHHRGLSVPVSPTYRVARVPLLTIYVTERQGRPVARNLPLSLLTDLVAAPWLRAQGLTIPDAPPPSIEPTRRPRQLSKVRTVGSLAEQEAARATLMGRLERPAHPWQHAAWALLLGDVQAARRSLARAADEARQRWKATVARPAGPLGWLSPKEVLPNQNYVREHFALALVLGDEDGLHETTPPLQAWLRSQEGRVPSVYGHAHGYLDLICDLLAGGERATPARVAVEQAGGPHPSTRVAAIALLDRDAALLREGLEGILAALTQDLERRSSPPAPLSEVAVHVAAAARRFGMPVSVDERYHEWPALVDGVRLPADLLGRVLWAGASGVPTRGEGETKARA
jgi:hypothetical protein